MGVAPDPTEMATTQLLPHLAAAGPEDAWRTFVAPDRPRILRWCRRPQADAAVEVSSRVLHKLVVGLARGVYRRHAGGSFRGWWRRAYRRKPLCDNEVQTRKRVVESLGPELNAYLKSIGAPKNR